MKVYAAKIFHLSEVLLVLGASVLLTTISAFSFASPKPIKTKLNTCTPKSNNNENLESSFSNKRRDFLKRVPSALLGLATVTTLTKVPPSLALDASSPVEELPTKQVVTASFDAIRYELLDPNGGVSYMQGRIDQQDWDGLLEFTKTYDLELRKKRMGTAKKLFQDKDIKSKATEYANAVTFDLIGINRSSRKGQENVEFANKYLEELRGDVTKFLSLEDTIQVQS